MGGGKIFPPRGKSKILPNILAADIFSGSLAAERGKRKQSNCKTEAPQK